MKPYCNQQNKENHCVKYALRPVDQAKIKQSDLEIVFVS